MKINNNEILKELIKNKHSFDQWYKWLSYIPKSHFKKLDLISKKERKDLTYADKEFVNNYEIEMMVSKLLKKYINNECTMNEYAFINDYISTRSLEELMLSKLTLEEYNTSMKKLEKLNSLQIKDLILIAKQQKENYKSISMINAYIYFQINQIITLRKLENINKKVNKNRR